jgi:prepilin-type N-terminal cleavage/methylation domain-containing protein
MVTAASRAPTGRRGFSLVEVLVVIVLMGIMLGMALPRFADVRDSMRIDGAAQQVVGDLRRLQVEAIKRNQSALFTRTGPSTYTLDFVGAREIDSGVTFDEVASTTSIRMASFGPPIGGGAVFVLKSGDLQRTITVTASGLVSVQ